MSDPRKTITLYLLTNDEKQSRKITLPLSYFKFGTFILAFAIVTLMAGFIDYFGLLAQSVENRKLKIENVNLQKKFQVVEGKLDSLQSGLDRVGTMTNKLKLITDTHMKDRTERLSFPSQINNANDKTAAADRMSNEEFMEQDPNLESDNPVNTMKGELAAEKSSANYTTLLIKIDEAIKDSLLKEQSVTELWEALSDDKAAARCPWEDEHSSGSRPYRLAFRLSY